MPSRERVRADQEALPPVPGQNPSRRRKERAIRRGEEDSPATALEDLELVVEHDGLKIQLIEAAADGWTTEAMDGSGGLCANATALVRFIWLHAVWGRGGRIAGAARTGGMAGVSSRAESRVDGVDFAFIFNTRHLMKMPVDTLASKLNGVMDSTAL